MPPTVQGAPNGCGRCAPFKAGRVAAEDLGDLQVQLHAPRQQAGPVRRLVFKNVVGDEVRVPPASRVHQHLAVDMKMDLVASHHNRSEAAPVLANKQTRIDLSTSAAMPVVATAK